MNGRGQDLKVTTRIWQIGSADRSCKQGITYEQMVGTVVNKQIEATPTKGVARSVKDLKIK
jgi:hypothetical protein